MQIFSKPFETMIEPDGFNQHPGSHSNHFEYLSIEEMEGLVINDLIHEPFSPPFTTTDENNSLETSSPTNAVNFSALSHDYYFENRSSFSFHDHHVNAGMVSQFSCPRENNIANSSLDSLEDLNSFEMEEVIDWLAVDHHDDRVVYSNGVSMDVASIKQPSLILPAADVELENEHGSSHLAEAYSEAIVKGHRELAEVIVRRINEKVSPAGEARERLLYHSFHALDKQSDGYIKQESSKVFHAAFETIYRIFVNGSFAHLGANSAILEAMPRDTIEVLHIIDFDIGEGIQWSSLIVSLAQQQKLLQQRSFGFLHRQMSLKITSIKWKEEGSMCSANSMDSSSQWRFEETKKRLQEYTNFHGLKLKADEIELQDLAKEIQMKKKRGEWLAFNCMWALPHMGRRRSRRKAMEFLKAAEGFLADSERHGVITYGDGENFERIIKNCSCFRSFFDSYTKHYQTLLECMEQSFPPRLAEARIAMESLFVAPYVSAQSLHDMWREMKELVSVSGGFQPSGLGLKVSSERLMEAKAMVREGESLYTVMTEGENNSNEMVLEWRGTPLMRVTAWR